jgi:hypothetical protein
MVDYFAQQFEPDVFGSDVESQNAGLADIINTAPTTSTKWGKYDVQNDVVNNLVQQLQKQQAGGMAKYYQGEGFGSIDANTLDMARNLAASGVTDINQVAKKTVTDPGYFTSTEQGDAWTPEQTRDVIVNKATGEPLISNYAERTGGNLWSGTFAGKGNTGYGVDFDSQGNPLFYTQGASSNDLAALLQDLGPIAQIGLAIATAGMSLPATLATNFAFQVASGVPVNDALKGAVTGLIANQVLNMDMLKDATKAINQIDSTGTLAKTFQGATVGAIQATARGTDVLEGALAGGKNGLASGVATTGLNSIDDFKSLSPAEQQIFANITGGVLSGKTGEQIALNAISTAANTNVAEEKKYGPLNAKQLSELEADELAKYNEGGTKALFDYQRDIANLESLTNSGRTGDDMGGNVDAEVGQGIEQDILHNLENAGLERKTAAESVGLDPNAVNITGNKENQVGTQQNLDNSLLLQNLISAGGDSSNLNQDRVVITDKKDGTQTNALTGLNDAADFIPPVGSVVNNNLEELVITGKNTDNTLNNNATINTNNDIVTTLLNNNNNIVKDKVDDKVAVNVTLPVDQKTTAATGGGGAGRPSSKNATGPLQLMQDYFGTDVSRINSTPASAFKLSGGGDIDELLRLLRG